MSDQVLGTIVLAAFVLIGNLLRKGGWLERWRSRTGTSRKPPPLPSSGGVNPASPDAQMRRLLEALGRPATDSLPPPAPPAPKGRPPVLTARPPQRGDVFPTTSRQKSKKQRKRERDRELREAMAASAHKAPPPLSAMPAVIAAVARTAHEVAPPTLLLPAARARERRAAPAIMGAALRQRFSRKDSAREAVLLAEILGPPLALRLPAADAQFS